MIGGMQQAGRHLCATDMEDIHIAMSRCCNNIVAGRVPERQRLMKLLHRQAEEVPLLLPI